MSRSAWYSRASAIVLATGTASLNVCAGDGGRDGPGQERGVRLTHVTVASDPERFKGWPASLGLWSWGDEILVAYLDCALDTLTDGHAMMPPCVTEQARSTDGGMTWVIEVPRTVDGRELTADEVLSTHSRLKVPIDFRHADLAFGIVGTDSIALFAYSYDRGRHWYGPHVPPSFGFESELANPDYIVNGPQDMMWFFFYSHAEPYDLDTLTGVHTYERPFLARTEDGGITWHLVSATVDTVTEPNPIGVYYASEPSSERLSPTKLVSVSRWARDDGAEPWPSWMEAWVSEDDGESWSFMSRIADGPGTRPNVVVVPDGRLVLTYEHRAPPYGIRARVSEDDGKRWSDPFILRSDGGNWDIGYTVNAARSDGSIVTVYYFNREEHGPRTIEATIWDPRVAFPQ